MNDINALRQQVKALAANPDADALERIEALEQLVAALEKPIDNDSITIEWHIDDVHMVRPDLTDEQAQEVLFAAKRYHDAEQGINWGVLEAHADFIFGKEGE
jgi:hypothetical protein